MDTTAATTADLALDKLPFEDRYGGYVLKYRPQPTPDGRYLAYVIVSCRLGQLQTVAALLPDLPSFASQGEAASAGWMAGMGWVDRVRKAAQPSAS